MHIENNWEDPGISRMAKLELVLKGVKMVQAAKHKPEVRQPITIELLQKMKRVWYEQAPGWDERMFWAAVSLCFCGFLRSGEITVPSDSAFDETQHLTFEDVAVDQLTNPTTL